LPAVVRARAMRRLALALPITMGPQAAPIPGGSTLDAPGPSPADAPSLAARLISARVPAWSLLVSFAAGGALGLSVAMGPRAPPGSVPAKPAPVTMGPQAAPAPAPAEPAPVTMAPQAAPDPALQGSLATSPARLPSPPPSTRA